MLGQGEYQRPFVEYVTISVNYIDVQVVLYVNHCLVKTIS